MYEFGQKLLEDEHFWDHIEQQVPVQVYWNGQHKDIGYVESFSDSFVMLNDTLYYRHLYTFVSRPGY